MSTFQGSRVAKGSRGKGKGRNGKPSKAGSSDEEQKTKDHSRRPSNGDRKVLFDGNGAASKTSKLPRPMGNNILRNNTWGKQITPTTSKDTNKTSSTSSSPFTQKSADQSWRNPTMRGNSSYSKRMVDLYQMLKMNREKERKDAIRNGFLADPNKPTSLANAITPVGTCQDMCPEFERVERIVQNMVDGCEKNISQSSDTKVPCEEYMVKRFRRSAAGYDEQLPSDIRPPLVLQRTLNYLFEEVVGGPQSLGRIHKFVWDRTRGIRNDFSIQQVTKLEDLRIAIDCFERIARFHLLSMHQLSRSGQDNADFDHHQEREQLNNTLLSLMYYYDDSRHRLTSPNEAEFRTYCIIFEIQDQRPDLEDRSQNWPKPLLKDPRVQTAMKLYAAAGNTSDEQGPLRPRTSFAIAQANYGRYWSVVGSNAVSYLMACAAEIYFNLIRGMALEEIWKAYKRGGLTKMEDWVLGDLATALGYDNEDQVQKFCEEHGFTIREREDGESFLDIGSVSGKWLADTNPHRKQTFSKNLVEKKRLGRTLPAVINGLTVSESRAKGQIEGSSASEGSPASKADDEPLFLNDDLPENYSKFFKPTANNGTVETPASLALSRPSTNPFSFTETITPFQNTQNPAALTFPNPFSNPPLPALSTFGQPSGLPEAPNTPETPFSTEVSHSISISSPAKTPPVFNFATPAASAVGVLSSSFTTGQNRLQQLKPMNLQPQGVFGQPSVSNNATSTPIINTKSSFDFTATTSSTSIFASQQTKQNLNAGPPHPLKTPFSLTTPTSTTNPSPSKPFVFPSQVSTTSNATFFPSLPSAVEDPMPNILDQTKPILFPSSPQSTPVSTTLDIPKTTRLSPTGFIFKSPPSSSPDLSQQKFAPTITPPTLQFPSQSPHTPHPPKSNAGPALSSQILPPQPPLQPIPTREQTNIGPPKPDPRSKALDQLAVAFVSNDDGLLQQFLEYTISPIIVKAIDQVRVERSREQISQARHFLLGKKYMRKWRNNAWRRGLSRKAKERRKDFAQSMQALAQSSRLPRSTSGGSSTSSSIYQSSEFTSQSRNTVMPPPSRLSTSQSNRQSPTTSDLQEQASPVQSETPRNKRKLADMTPNSHSFTGHHPKLQHKRSHTFGNTSNLLHSGRISKSGSSFSLNSSLFNSGPVINESLIKKARRLASGGRTDTTRSDYFKLKALGVDPDTPIVPRTRKRRMTDLSEAQAHKAPETSLPELRTHSNTSLHPANYSQTVPSSSQTKQADDDQLFAQMRQVREAMSESISWFRAEREKSERNSRSGSTHSRDQQPRVPVNETEKQRRLREFKPTPSRTEVRLRETGGGGLLPKGWGVVDNGKARIAEGRERMQGFAAIRMGFAGAWESEEGEDGRGGTGASVEDAIEL